MNALAHAILQAALITSLVFVMMAVIELISVLSHGRFRISGGTSGFRQYVLASFLGVTPGCAGVYLVDSMYSRRVLSLGAVTGALLATAGDEAFLMLAMFPSRALALFALLFVIGIAGGWLSEVVFRTFGLLQPEGCALADLHDEDLPTPQELRRWWPPRLRFQPLLPRLVIAGVLTFLLAALLGGFAEHHQGLPPAAASAGHSPGGFELWIFGTVAVLGLALTFVAPSHWLEEHLWHHLALHHIPQIFAWTAGALVAVHLLSTNFNLDRLLQGHGAWMLLGAALLGLIPISGPHLIVVTLFASGHLPFSVLLANSLVQDGHGLLPLLGISVRDALLAKLANLIIGLAIGGGVMLAGF